MENQQQQHHRDSNLMLDAKQRIAYPAGKKPTRDHHPHQGDTAPNSIAPDRKSRYSPSQTESALLRQEKQNVAYPKHKTTSKRLVTPSSKATEGNPTTTTSKKSTSVTNTGAQESHRSKLQHITEKRAAFDPQEETVVPQAATRAPPVPSSKDSTNKSRAATPTSNSALLQNAKAAIQYPRDHRATMEQQPIATQHQSNNPSFGSSQEAVDVEAATSMMPLATLTVDSPGRVPVQHHNTTNGLVVANLVVEDDSDLILTMPKAEDVDLDAAKQRTKKTKQIRKRIVLGVIVVIAIVALAAFLALRKDRKQKDADGVGTTNAVATTTAINTTNAPTSSPSQAPTSLEDVLMSILPLKTQEQIKGDSDSPQALAFDWLLEDHGILPNLGEARINQRYSLATLFFATGGDDWAEKDGWLNHSAHECAWFNKPDFYSKIAVSKFYDNWLWGYLEPAPTNCNEDGLYQHLWLDRNNLVGSLPDELYLLTSLQTLSVAFNELEGTISPLVGQLKVLEAVSFTDVATSSTIPSEFAMLTNLHVLALRNTNTLGSIPTELWQLTNLLHFDVEFNPGLQGTISPQIGRFHQLRYLLMDSSDISGTFPTELGQVSTLEWLSLGSNRVSRSLPSEFGLLENLSYISISDNLLESTLPTELGELTSATSLSVWGNKLSGSIPSELGLLTNLSVALKFKQSLFTGTIPTELGRLSGIRKLEFQENQFTGPIPSEFDQLRSIGHLSFANNLLSGPVPQELAVLQTTLHTLTLEGNPLLSGNVPEALCELNGTCVSSPFGPCEPEQGLVFDCSAKLCGCDCICS